MTDKDTMATLKKEIASFLRGRIANLQAVYLFGSTADGTTNAESDLDVAVLAEGPLTVDERWNAQDELALKVRRDVDLVDLKRASTVMRQQVVSKGIVIHDGDPAARQAFECFVYSSYARLNEERREILKVIHEEGRVYAG